MRGGRKSWINMDREGDCDKGERRADILLGM